MRVGSGVILFQLAGFLTSALADFYFAKHTQPEAERMPAVHPYYTSGKTYPEGF